MCIHICSLWTTHLYTPDVIARATCPQGQKAYGKKQTSL